MMKIFTQKMLVCMALLAFAAVGTAQTVLIVNSPADLAGEYPVVRGTIGDQDTEMVTGDIILGEDGVMGDTNGDGTFGTVTDGCEALTTDATGKIAVLDRGECSFFVKGESAEAAGAMALLVCNNVAGAPIIMGTGPNGEGTDIAIPCFMTTRDLCIALRAAVAAGDVVNITIEEREVECPVEYAPEVFFGQNPGEGDFSLPFDESGWTTVNIEPLDRDDVVWQRAEDGAPLFDRFFGSGTVIESPSACNGTASFSAVMHSIGDNPNPGSPPYTPYSAELISPVIDCSGRDNIIMEFYQLYNNLNLQSTWSWSIDGGATWSAPINIETDNVLNSVLNTETVTIPIPSFTNQANCRIKFTALMDFYYFTIDDLTLREEAIRDVRANVNWYATAPNYLSPSTLVDEIPFLIDIENIGNVDLTGVKVDVEVRDPNLNTVHSQTLEYGDLETGFLWENRPFPMTYTPDGTEGEYRIRYRVSADGGDIETNNVRDANFMVGGNVISKLPLEDPADPFIEGWRRGGTNFYSFGNYYHFPTDKWANGNFYVLDRVRGGISTSAAEPAGFLEAAVYRWVDDNEDGTIQAEERVQVAEGRATVFSSNVDMEIELFDVNEPDEKYVYQLGDDNGLVVMLHAKNIEEADAWFFSAVNVDGFPGINNPATVFAYDTLGINKYGGFYGIGSSNDDIEDRDFVMEPGPLVYYTPLFLTEMSGTGDFNEAITFSVFPNPTADVLNVELAFENQVNEAAITITDVTGKIVAAKKYVNVLDKTVPMDVTHLSTGMYTVRVVTEEGFNSTTFNVQR